MGRLFLRRVVAGETDRVICADHDVRVFIADQPDLPETDFARVYKVHFRSTPKLTGMKGQKGVAVFLAVSCPEPVVLLKSQPCGLTLQTETQGART